MLHPCAQAQPGLLTCENHGKLRRLLGPHYVVQLVEVLIENLAIQKKKSAEGLILGGGRNLSLNGKVGQEFGYLPLAHVARVPLLMKEDKTPDPTDVGIFGANTVVFGPDPVRNLVEELWWFMIGHVVPPGEECFLMSRADGCVKKILLLDEENIR
jgi:hypothetical protein